MSNFWRQVLLLSLALVLAAEVHHTLALAYGDNLHPSIASSLAVLDGKPDWRWFQNRLFGPYVAKAFMAATGKPDLGYVLFDLVCFGTAFVLAWRTGRCAAESWSGALAAMLTLTLGLMALFMPDWFYAWDATGLALFMGFAWLVASGARHRSISLLFAVALLNREDGLFIALYLTVQPVLDWWRSGDDPARPAFAWRKLVPGAACMIGGVLLIVLSRRYLLVEEMGPKLFGQPPNHDAFVQWNLEYNFNYVFHNISFETLEMPTFILVPPLVITCACVWLARARDGRFLGYALLNLTMVVTTLMFGSINEMHIWVDTLPPVVLAVSVALAGTASSARRSRTGRPILTSKYREPVLAILVALLLAITVQHVLGMVYTGYLLNSMQAGLSVLDGTPHWRIFQSRLLGPFVALAFILVTGEPGPGVILFDVTCFGAALVLAWRLGSRVVASRAGALAAMLTLATGLVATFMRPWFYPWDVVGVALFMGFAWLVATNAKYYWIVALFCVAIWNRDDALFMALFLAIQPVITWWQARGDPARRPIAWRQVAIGVACMILGVILITTLRRLLLVHETGPELFGGDSDSNMFFSWNLPFNYDLVVHGIPLSALGLPAFLLVPPLAVTLTCIYLARTSGGRYLSYALVNMAMTVATVMFGITSELRQWAVLAPSVVLAASIALAKADAPDRPAPPGPNQIAGL